MADVNKKLTSSHKELDIKYNTQLADWFTKTIVEPVKYDRRLKDLEPLPTFVKVGKEFKLLTDVLPTVKA